MSPRNNPVQVAMVAVIVFGCAGVLWLAARVWSIERRATHILAALEARPMPASEPTPEVAASAGESLPDRGPRNGGGEVNPLDELSPDLSELIQKKNLFGLPPRPGQPTLNGVIGAMANINGNWIEVGQESNGIELLQVNGDRVTIEFQGEQIELSLWQNLPGTAPSTPSPPAGPAPPTATPAATGGAEREPRTRERAEREPRIRERGERRSAIIDDASVPRQR